MQGLVEFYDSYQRYPFNNETTFLSNDSRGTQRRKNKGKPQSERFYKNEKIDKDIASEKGIVNIYTILLPRINLPTCIYYVGVELLPGNQLDKLIGGLKKHGNNCKNVHDNDT